MQKTAAQSQQESQKTRAQLVLFENQSTKKNMRAFNVARPRQRNIYLITSPTTCNLHAYRQASELRLNSFSSQLLYFRSNSYFTSTTLFGGELVGGVMVSWWRDGFSVASWLVARRPDTVTRDRDNKAHTHTHLPPLYQKIENMKIERCGN